MHLLSRDLSCDTSQTLICDERTVIEDDRVLYLTVRGRCRDIFSSCFILIELWLQLDDKLLEVF